MGKDSHGSSWNSFYFCFRCPLDLLSIRRHHRPCSYDVCAVISPTQNSLWSGAWTAHTSQGGRAGSCRPLKWQPVVENGGGACACLGSRAERPLLLSLATRVVCVGPWENPPSRVSTFWKDRLPGFWTPPDLSVFSVGYSDLSPQASTSLYTPQSSSCQGCLKVA